MQWFLNVVSSSLLSLKTHHLLHSGLFRDYLFRHLSDQVRFNIITTKYLLQHLSWMTCKWGFNKVVNCKQMLRNKYISYVVRCRSVTTCRAALLRHALDTIFGHLAFIGVRKLPKNRFLKDVSFLNGFQWTFELRPRHDGATVQLDWNTTTSSRHPFKQDTFHFASKYAVYLA